MALFLVVLIAAGTLAFGAVYAWGYVPLFTVAAGMGLWGLRRGGVAPEMRPLATALLLVWFAVSVQLVPLPQSLVEWLSPATASLSAGYHLAVPGGAEGWLPLSVDPARTRVALLALGALGVYLLGMPALLPAQALRALPPALAIFAVPLALFSLYNREHTNNLVYWFWVPVESARGNVFGPFVNRNHYGGWMLMTLSVLVGWLFGRIEGTLPGRQAARVRLAGWLSSGEASGIVLMALAVLVGALSLVWTVSRSAILSFGAASVAFAWLVLARRRLSHARRAIGLVILATVLLAPVLRRGPVELVEWFQDNNLTSRVDAWRDGWDVIRAFPWTGTGLNTYSVAMLFYQTRNRDSHMSRAHNDYVQLLAEGGVLVAVPAAVAVIVLAAAIRRNLRAARAEGRGYWIRAGSAVGLVAMAIQETLEFSLQIPVNALLFCTLAAIALAPAVATARVTPSPRDNMPASRKPADVSVPEV